MEQAGERFVIELEAQRHRVPAAVRLRKALKVLLRSFGLKCLSATSAPHAPADLPGESGSSPMGEERPREEAGSRAVSDRKASEIR
jgi:hypothetical protein